MLEASSYRDLSSRKTETASLFRGVPLSSLSNNARGLVLEEIVRHEEERLFGITRPPLPAAHGGRVPHELIGQDGLLVEAKAAQLMKEKGSWRFLFQNLKNIEFDRAVFTLYTPRGLYLVQWDGKTGYYNQGKQTVAKGEAVSISAPAKHGWNAALDAILETRLPEDLINEVRYDNPIYTEMFKREIPSLRILHDTPFSIMSSSLRGHVLHEVVRRYEERIDLAEPLGRLRIPGGDRCLPNPSSDWERKDGLRVEVKSSILSYRVDRDQWMFRFANVKPHEFDILRLVFCTPFGLYLVDWDGTRFGRNSLHTRITGGRIDVLGTPSRSWKDSVFTILREKVPGQIFAFLPWT